MAAAPAPAAPPEPAPPPAPSPRELLRKEPQRFDLDQAAFVAGFSAGRDVVALPYSAPANLSLPLAEVSGFDDASGRITTPLFGMIGPAGTLPRHYTATAGAQLRRRQDALPKFLELLSRRFTGMWVRAGAKYRPARDPVPAERALDAAIGMLTGGLSGRVSAAPSVLRYHAGNLSARTRSAERLRAMLEEEIGRPVEIVEFAGGWLRLPEAEQTRLGAAHSTLGMDMAIGARVWEPQSRFIVRVGPIGRALFDRLLPGEPLHARLCSMIRLFVGPEQDFALNPILSPDALPEPVLSGAAGMRLGLTSWMGQTAPRTQPVRDAMLRPPPF
ncbi:type VI secretion system baseplate subunit TssG [Rhodovarius crocodyli]|uniref:Type VI secretion system baseplate subunit TssG n=1 Tax=Rhodovarius crocodyli TaxID=1979269 RepID=A0A437MMF0_9PROT|nr:type VI secretion system baseplate subunit TssG [Rhodovarius crocodyli]